MDTDTLHLAPALAARTYLLRFTSFYNPGRGVSIPCDAAGQVDLDALSHGLRIAYLAARALIGHEYSYPKVQACP